MLDPSEENQRASSRGDNIYELSTEEIVFLSLIGFGILVLVFVSLGFKTLLHLQGGTSESAVAFKDLSLKATANSGAPPCKF